MLAQWHVLLHEHLNLADVCGSAPGGVGARKKVLYFRPSSRTLEERGTKKEFSAEMGWACVMSFSDIVLFSSHYRGDFLIVFEVSWP